MKIAGHFSHPSCFSLHVLVVAMVLEELTSWKTDLLEWNPEVNGLLYCMMSLNHLVVCVFVNDVNMFSPSHVKICLFVLSAFLSGQWKIKRRSGEILSFCLVTSEEAAAQWERRSSRSMTFSLPTSCENLRSKLLLQGLLLRLYRIWYNTND